MTTNNLSRKNIVIIGGTAGIGLATAVAASELGAMCGPQDNPATYRQSKRIECG